MAEFVIEGQQPTTYLGAGGKPVTGFQVWGTFTEYDEYFEINVPSLEESVVVPAIEALLDQRNTLAQYQPEE